MSSKKESPNELKTNTCNATGPESNLFPIQYYTAMIIVVIVTTLITLPLLKANSGKRD